VNRDEFKRTIGYGESAIGHLRANETPAYPRNYELWYTYASGHQQELNRAVNDALRVAGRLDPEQTARIYEQFLSPLRASDRIEHIGGQLSQTLRGVMHTIEGARSDNASYAKTLEGASGQLGRSSVNQDDLRRIASELFNETQLMSDRNKELEQRLGAQRREIDELQASLEAIRNESLTDPLTGLANRKCFDNALARAFAEAEGSRQPFALLMCDIDHFKKFNDSFGHQTGDQVLRLVASTVKQTLRTGDLAARYGGEEFAILLLGTALEQSAIVGEHVREAVMAKELIKRSTGERLGRITLSVGCAAWRPGDSPNALIERADQALYRSKSLGRNRVSLESPAEAAAVA
jgi:diguanylate cyclase